MNKEEERRIKTNMQMSRRALRKMTLNDMVVATKPFLQRHMQCVRDGYEITINDFGVWCSNDDPMPKLGDE